MSAILTPTQVAGDSSGSYLAKPTIRTLQIGNVWFEERQGGLARVYYELFRHLPQTGVDFRGLVIGSGGIAKRYGPETLSEFASARESMASRLFKARSAVRQVLATQPVDLIASHFALYTFPALLELSRVPLVVHFHGPWASESGVEGAAGIRSRLQAAVESAVYRRAKRFIVLSRAFANELIERYRVPADAVRVVPGGVDIQRFNCSVSRSEARERLGLPQDRFVIVAVRRLANRMGLEDLVQTVKLLAHKHPEVLVYIAGSGALADKLQSLIEHLDLTGNVALLGRVPDDLLPLVYRGADLSVVPTVALEGFGMITLESLASGTPVMVTPIGGLPEVVQNLSKNLIFEDSGAPAMTRALDDVLSGRRVLPNESQCRKYVEAHFTWWDAARKTRDVYLEALS
jgi:glycosyltransferase involved in cell wall biosynthesis